MTGAAADGRPLSSQGFGGTPVKKTNSSRGGAWKIWFT
jgi:hypothetical protein